MATKRTTMNGVTMQGYVFSTTRLELKTVKNQASENFGKEFIQGELNLALNDTMTNIVPIHFSYVTPMTKNNKPNSNFTILKKIIENPKLTVSEGGKENAMKISVSTAFGVNDYLPKESEDVVSTVRCEGGFMRELDNFNVDLIAKKNCDIQMKVMCYGIRFLDEDDSPDHVQMKGYTFSFKKELIPITFDLYNAKLANYCVDSEMSSKHMMAFSVVSGFIDNANVVKDVEEEQPWGEIVVTQTTDRHHEIHVDKMTLVEDMDSIMTAEEFKTALQNREIAVAEVKSRTLEYRKNPPKSSVTANVSNSNSWNFDAAPTF